MGHFVAKSVGRKTSREGDGNEKKQRKIANEDRKIALLSLF